jgi:hypothetical protein
MAPRAPPPHPGRAPARRRSEEGVGRGGRGDRLVVGRDGGVGSRGESGRINQSNQFFCSSYSGCGNFLLGFSLHFLPAADTGAVGGEAREGGRRGEERSRRAGGGGLGPGLVDLVGLAVEPEVRDTEHGASPFYST